MLIGAHSDRNNLDAQAVDNTHKELIFIHMNVAADIFFVLGVNLGILLVLTINLPSADISSIFDCRFDV